MSVPSFGRRLLAITGPFADGAFSVERLSGREGLGECFGFDVTLLSEAADFDLSRLVGDTVCLTVDRGENQPRFIHGYVTRAARIGTFDRHARYTIHLSPWLFLLSGRVNNRVFQKQSAPDIAKALFREHGFADFEDQLSGDHPQREFVVQYRESDLAFVSRLLERAGIYYFFRHERGRHVLVLADSPSAHATVPSAEAIPFHPEGSAAPGSGEVINRWEVVRQWRVGSVASSDFDFERPRADLTARVQDGSSPDQRHLEVFDYPAGATRQPQVESFVRTRLAGLRADAATCLAGGDVQSLSAGDLFALADFPDDEQNKRYLIVSAWFDAVNNGHDSGEADDPGAFHSGFAVIDAAQTYRSPLATPRPRVEGPETAIVVGEEGEEITTDAYGRVKIQFHWDREGKHDQDSSCWVRVAQIWAGQGWGAMHIPRIGQEVIVEFLGGDPDRPIVTGRVYNGDNLPPYALPENKTQSGIRSRSTKGGGPNNFNEIRFEDKKGNEELHVQAERDFTAKVKNSRSADVGADDCLTVGGDRSVTVTGNLATTVKGGGKDQTQSSLEVTGNHRVHATRRIDVVGDEHIRLGCGDSFILVDKDQIRIQSGGKAYVLVEKTVVAEGADRASVLVSDNVVLSGARSGSVVVDDGVTARSSASAMVMVDRNKNITIDGGKVQVSGSAQTTLSGGAGSIKADPGGVEVEGPQIKLNG